MEKNFHLDYNIDLDEPDYLYLGTSKMIDFDELRKANHDNPEFKMYVTSYYNEACANAFASKLKELNQHREYNINVDGTRIPILIADNVDDLKDNTTAYIYAFLYNDNFQKEENHIFSIDEVIKPMGMAEISYRDYKVYYRINQTKQKVKVMSNKV